MVGHSIAKKYFKGDIVSFDARKRQTLKTSFILQQVLQTIKTLLESRGFTFLANVANDGYKVCDTFFWSYYPSSN